MNIYTEKIIMMNKLNNKILFIYFGLLVCQLPTSYSINTLNPYAKYRIAYEDGLPNQSIIDMRLMSDNNIIVGTSGGLGIISQNENDYISIIDSNLPGGGNPALDTYNAEDIIVVSGIQSSAYDVNGDGINDPEGTGISWSLDNGQTWNFIEQPQDETLGLSDCSDLTCNTPNDFTDCNQYNSYSDPVDCDCECWPSITGCYWDGSSCNPGSTLVFFPWDNTFLEAFPSTTTVLNITYDLSVDTENEFIYAASWAGMLRRFNYTDPNPTWELIALPMDNMPSMDCGGDTNYETLDYIYKPIDPPNGSHNHKVFSVFTDTYDDETYIWAGTANGVNRGILQEDGCIDWVHYTKDDGLDGNWIIDIIPQDIGNDIPRIWLISYDLPAPPKPHGLSYSDDNGETWNVVHQFSEQYTDLNENEIYDIEDEFIDCDINNLNICEDNWQWNNSMGNGIYDGAVVYNLYFTDSVLYAATNRGLYWTTENNIHNWTKIDIPEFILKELKFIEDSNDFYDEIIYSCILRDDDFFIGTPYGLVTVNNIGININNPNLWDDENWSSYIPSEQEIVEQNKLNIYPNPFQISKTGNRPFVTFEYKSNTDGEITIFDFSMNMVNSFDCTQDHNIVENIKCEWYGENINGINVANGVYFCRLKTEKSEAWGKVMVINLSGGDYE